MADNVNLDILAALGGVENLDLGFYILLIFVGALLVSGIIVLIIFIRLYRIKVRVRRLIKGRSVIFDDIAREKKDRNGNYYLKLLRLNEMMPLPPEEAIDLNRKGKIILEAYRTQTGEYIYITDKPKVKVLPKSILRIKGKEEKERAVQEWKARHDVEYAFHPFTSNQRAIVVNQVIKAQQRKSTSWKMQIPVIVSIAALVILVISLMVFYGEIAAPVLKANDQVIAQNKITTEQLRILQEINAKVQSIPSEGQAGKSPPD